MKSSPLLFFLSSIVFLLSINDRCQRMATGSVCRYRHLIASHPDAIADRFRSGLLSEEEIKNIIAGLDDKSLPAVMKHFKANYAGKVDMGLVNKIARG